MNEFVKMTIDSRKDAFFNAYDINDKFAKEIDELFVDIYKFGESCSDPQDFETKFASSDLNKKYIDLFTRVGKSSFPKEYNSETGTYEKSKTEKVVEEAASDAKYLADEITMPARRKARAEFDSKMRNTPLGKIEQAQNTFYLFKKFKKKKPEENMEEEN